MRPRYVDTLTGTFKTPKLAPKTNHARAGRENGRFLAFFSNSGRDRTSCPWSYQPYFEAGCASFTVTASEWHGQGAGSAPGTVAPSAVPVPVNDTAPVPVPDLPGGGDAPPSPSPICGDGDAPRPVRRVPAGPVPIGPRARVRVGASCQWARCAQRGFQLQSQVRWC
jgi:hypothetical protein